MERCENDVCGLDKFKKVVQLHDKDKFGKEYPIFPITYTHAVYDKNGASLESMLAQFNNVFLQYQGTAKDTRLLLPKEMRRKGIQITYRNMNDEVVTEKCVNDSQSDNDHWGLDANWMRIDELSLQGDISVSKSGTWVINGADTGVKALGPKGDNGLTPWMKTIDNKLYYSYDNKTWELASDYIAAWFRFTGTSGSSQAGNIGKIQISRDEGNTWADLSGEFTNNLRIKGYVATTSDLPSNAVQGDIYGVGPTYAESDTDHTNPIYRLHVKDGSGWIDNGQFTSIAAGIVQELGDSETEVVSQKIVTMLRDCSQVFYTKKISSTYVDSTNTEKTDSNFDLFYYDVSKSTLMLLFFATGGGRALFLNSTGDIIGTPFQNGNTADYYKNVWKVIDIPEGATVFKLTQAKTLSSRPQSLPQKVLINNCNLGISPLDDNTMKRYVQDSIKDTLNKNYIDVPYSKVIPSTYVNITNEEKTDTHFNLYYYDVVNSPQIMLFVGTGGGYVVFVDSDNTIVGDAYQTTGPDTYVNNWVTLTVPTNAVRVKITQAKQSAEHPESYPCRVLAINQSYPSYEEEKYSEWKGKKVLFIGDSITDTGYYVTSFQSLTGCVAYNRGLSGTTLAKGNVSNSICERLDLPASDLTTNKGGGFPTQADLVFVLGGINDWGRLKSQVFGTFEDAIDNTTFCGALKYLYRGLRTKYPMAKIVILNLLHCYSPDTFPNWNELNYQNGDETKAIIINQNTVGKNMYDYRDAIKNCAEMYGFPVIDFFEVGFTATLFEDRTRYYIDGLHPNALGGELMAKFMVNQLKTK